MGAAVQPIAGKPAPTGIAQLSRLVHQLVGAALCRERAAKRPPDFGVTSTGAGAALQPFRGTRPLLQRSARVSEIFWKAGAVTRQAFLPRHAQDLWERPCAAKGPQSGPPDFGVASTVAGAASQPFRGTRPLLQRTARVSEIFWKAGAVTRQAFLPRHAQDLWERPCVAMGRKAAPAICTAKLKIWGRFAAHRDTR